MGARIQTAMIIDDDNDLSMLLACILEKRKIHVMLVETLADAENFLQYLKPTMIFLDNSFPDGLGVNFIKNIKSADTSIKVIMMTGDDAKWIEEKAFTEGVDYFMKKPFNDQVIDVVLDSVHEMK